MEPLSLRTRRVFASVSFILFLIILPIAGLYASGYRLSGFSLVSTGGIHISAPLSGTSISLNAEELERTSLFSKTFFFDNLTPGSYVIQAETEGYYPWSKTLVVESRLVTDVSVLSIPQPVRLFELTQATSTLASVDALSTTSTTQLISADDYAVIADVFATTTPTLKNTGTSTEEQVSPSVDIESGVGLVIEDGDLLVRWERNSNPPSSFCTRPSLCVTHFFIERTPQTVTDAEFFGGGVIYRTEESGVMLSEVDIRQPRLVVSIYSDPQASFRIIDGTLYIKDGETIYRVEGF